MTEGQVNYIRYLLAVFETGSRISDAKLAPNCLGKGLLSVRKTYGWLLVEK